MKNRFGGDFISYFLGLAFNVLFAFDSLRKEVEEAPSLDIILLIYI